ncbi:hypothetical protein CRUP_001269 [Coryphaenoides rupestris]|nr:hypothetical protein CRUP_001269 [Coryphaenoides rupestris]
MDDWKSREQRRGRGLLEAGGGGGGQRPLFITKSNAPSAGSMWEEEMVTPSPSSSSHVLHVKAVLCAEDDHYNE